MSTGAFDLAAIERSLRAVQRDFAHINGALGTSRDPLSDEVVDYLLAGYRYLAHLLAEGIDPLAVGNSRHLLRLNCLVLCGSCPGEREEWPPHLEQTARRFYDDRSPGGVRALMNYLADHGGDTVWERAAGAYIHILSEPQLFVEGNHRTGALVMSALLCGAGQPPFVLTPGNARAYFDPSSLIKGSRKRSLRAWVTMPPLRRRLARLLREGAAG
ncbi:hypothetical protein [Endothiovibrio diazotrophicus]